MWLSLVTAQTLADGLEAWHPHGELGFSRDREAVLGEPGGVGYRTSGEVGDGDVFEDDRGSLGVVLGEPFEDRAGYLLCLVELADPRVGRDAAGVEPVLIEEPRPDPILVRIGDAVGFGGLVPGFERLHLVAECGAFFCVPCGEPGQRSGRWHCGAFGRF